MQVSDNMKFLKETTEWPDSTPNHTYLVDDSKTYMHGYVPQGTDVLKMFRGKIQISVSRRKFKEVSNTFGYVEPTLVSTPDRWEVKGSKGDTYVVERVGGTLTCTCSGFKFRSKCKHTEAK
jgi:hypothetical protein